MSKGGFFNNYFYGKSDRRDYTKDDLPQTRFQLFRTVLSVRRGSMLGLNLLYLCFWLPALFWTLLNLMQFGAENISLYSLIFTWLVILCPLIALTGPFNMGASYVMRNWARDEHSFVWAHFWAGVKANWKQGLLFGLINGLSPLISFISLWFYGQLLGASPVFYLPICIILCAYLLWNLCALTLPALLVGYRLSFTAALKNALLTAIAQLPRAFGILLATLAFPLLLFISFCFFPSVLNWLATAAFLYYVLIGLSMNKLITASYANMICEKYINTKIEGAGIDIGLRSASQTTLNTSNEETT